MAKVMPVGTVRHWKKGDVIKAHDGTAMHSGWIGLESPEHLRQVFKEADTLANILYKKKEPISGEVYLDHELREVKRPPDKNSGPYSPDKFKIYEGFYGAGKYSFFNEFSRLFMAKKIEAQEYYIDMLRRYNKEEKQGNDRLDRTSSDEKKMIRRRSKESFVFSGEELNEGDAHDIVALVKKVYKHMEKGMKLEPDEKKVYDKAAALVDGLPINYVRLKEAMRRKELAVKLIGKKFPDNWAIRESFRIKATEKLNEYLKKYKDRIAEDEAKDQEATFGVSLDAPVDEFYEAVYDKIDGELHKVKNFDFETLKGKKHDIVMKGAHNGEPTHDCIVIDWKKMIEKNSDLQAEFPEATYWIGKPKPKDKESDPQLYYMSPIEPEDELYYKAQFHQMKYPFAELVKLRFATKYQKELDGNWTFDLLPAMENIERALTGLPEGHVLNNKYIETFSQQSFNGGSHGGYAWFSDHDSKINFSDECAKHASIWARSSIAPEFKATLYHEIGHGVSKRFGRDGNLDYKKFTVAAGWSYHQAELRAGFTRTGDDKNLPRHGSNSGTKLLTAYAHKSQEEAFAEYYSIYNLHKDAIDKWLETGESKHLKETYAVEVPMKIEKKQLKEYFNDGSNWALSSQIKNRLIDFKGRNKINIQEHLGLDLISPHRCSTVKTEKNKYSPPKVLGRKHRQAHYVPPVVAVKDKNKYKLLDGVNRQKEFMLKHKMMPAQLISQELYSQMKKNDFTDEEITGIVSFHLKDSMVPIQVSQPVKREGLMYRNNVLDYKDLEKNIQPIRAMKKIFHSSALVKALEQTFGIVKQGHEQGSVTDVDYFNAIVKYNEHREKLLNGRTS